MNNTDLRKHCYAMGYSDGEVGAFYDGYEKGRVDAIEEYKHLLKETFNNALPLNYHCTKPFFTLYNVRLLTDAVARELKGAEE